MLKPKFSREVLWLVGRDEKGFGEHIEEMRNTYGSKMSFRRDVLLNVGGYEHRA